MQKIEKTKNSTQLLRFLAILVLIAGFGLRIAKANALPLDQVEASLAMNAVNLFEDDTQISQPFYSVITGILFWLSEDSNMAARLVPVLVGTALILLPWLTGDWLSERTKLILSIGFAFDPALVAASKTVGSMVIAVTALFLAILLFLKKKPVGVGVASAIVFMSGPAFVTGGLAYGLAFLMVLIRHDEAGKVKASLREYSWKPTLIAFAVSYGLISSAFFMQPGGIGASFQDIANLFNPVELQPISLGVMAIVIAVLVYEFVPLLFSVWGWVKDHGEAKLWLRFCLWASVFVFVLLLINPDRYALNLAWLSVPLWTVAAVQIDRLLEEFSSFEPISLAIAAFFLLMIGFVLFTFVGAVNVDGANYMIYPEETQQKLVVRSLLVVGGLLLVGITYFLVGYTWNVSIAQNAMMAGVGFYLVVFGLLGTSWHSAFLGVEQEAEIWHQSSVLVDGDRVLETISDISEMNHGQRVNQPIMIVGINSPALEWHLRDHEVQTVQSLTSTESPEMIITNLIDAQMWTAEYTGQDFRLSTTQNWSLFSLQEWLSWTIFHKVEITNDDMAILWVRTDQFPGQTLSD